MIHDFDPAIAVTPFGAVYWYGAVYSFGFLGFFLWFWTRRSQTGLSDRDVFTLTILFATGVLVGARAFDILVYELDYYRQRPLAALDWWRGGMASHGVLIGGLATTYVFARSRRMPILALLDEIVVPGVFLMAVGRIGNFIEGGVIGSETDVAWAFIYPNVEGPRHPVALYESAKNFLILPILIWAIRIWPPGKGVVTALFVALYASMRFAVDLLRDYEAAWLGLGTGQVFNLLMAAIGFLLLLAVLRWDQPIAPPKRTAKRPVGRVQVAAVIFLFLYPLGIPTSWTAENIAQIREESSNSLQTD
ncbi:MAG: prolipoprotein diacylglyceryl transferase [Paracoccaceae bacterium]|nr:prolipoprotein diacylglyceryl transferase [Paracoccaceae bacterium]